MENELSEIRSSRHLLEEKIRASETIRRRLHNQIQVSIHF